MKQDSIRDLLDKCLEDLENRIDPSIEDELHAEWLAFTSGQFRGDFFRPGRKRQAPPAFTWPHIHINHAQKNEDAMLLSEYASWSCNLALACHSGLIMCVRSNYGTGILPSLFGTELFVMDEKLNTQQTTKPLPDLHSIQAAIERGIPPLTSGLGGKVLQTGRRLSEVAKRYPKISKYVHIYHPDLQSPMDAVELLWGSNLFLDIIDHPELVHTMLRLVTDTYIRFIREWEKIIPPQDGHAIHWCVMHRGQIMLRDDSAMNFSPAMYDEFIRPYDAEILKQLGGGAVHFCGRGDHYIESCCQMEGLYAINMSQPEYNNMETIFHHTVDRGIQLLGLAAPVTAAALNRGRDLHNCVYSS